MKKIALCSLLVCLGFVADSFAATYNCTVQEMSALSRKKSNEFLFPTTGDYKDANGRALVCGHRTTEGCDSGTVVVVAGNHWHENIQSDYMKVYRCSTNGGNAWADVGYTALEECSSDQRKNWVKIGTINDQNIFCDKKINTFYKGGYCTNACFTSECENCGKNDENRRDDRDDRHDNREDDIPSVTGCQDDKDCPEGKKCMYVDGDKTALGGAPMWADLKGGQCYDAEHIDCFRATGLGDPAIWSGNPAKCSCGSKNGIEYSWLPSKRKCVAEGNNNNNNNNKKTCKELYKGHPEAIACCESKDAKWQKLIGNPNGGECRCNDGKSKWKYDEKNKTGKCVGTNTTPVETCKYTFTSKIKCWDGSTFTEKTELELEKSLFDGNCTDQTVPDFKTWFNNLANNVIKGRVKDLCQDKPVSSEPEPQKPTFDSAKLNAATSAMSNFFSSAEDNRSGLRTADGKFNTVRLASDITAGVVLGTVGGVVSGVVIKKKQVEKGFEALHCTVGGQKIADWGDEFTIGLQK